MFHLVLGRVLVMLDIWRASTIRMILMSKCQTSIFVMQPPLLIYAACHTKDDRGKEGGPSPVPLLSVV